MSNLKKVFDRAYAAARQRSFIRGLLGRPNGDDTYTVVSPTRPDFYFVRVSQEGKQSVTLAKHMGRVAARANAPVRMILENNVLVIDGYDDFYYSAATSGDQSNTFGVPAHTHALGSGLEYMVEAMRLEPGLVHPVGGWNVKIEPFRYLNGSTWETYGGATISLLANRPATSGKHRLAVVTVDPATNVASVVNGSDQDYATTLTQADIDAISIGTKIPLGAVVIRADDTTINIQARFIDARGWLNLGGSGGGTLAGLSDTTITAPSNGQQLYYDTVLGWYNDNPAAIPENLEDLADVTFTTLADGHSLVYDSGTNDWINVAMLLSLLFDVSIGTLADGDILKYNDGTEMWENVPPGEVVAGGTLNDLSDVTITTPADRDVLVYDSGSGEWIDRHTGRQLITGWSFRDNTILSSSAYAWKGNRFTPDTDVDLYAMCYFGTIVANGVYQAAVITGTGSPGNISTVTKSASYTVGASPASTTGAHIWLEFSTPVRLTAGTIYGLMLGRTDGSNTYVLPVPFNGGTLPSNAVPMPGLSHGNGWRVADATLSAGSAIDATVGNSMSCGFRFRYPNSVY